MTCTTDQILKMKKREWPMNKLKQPVNNYIEKGPDLFVGLTFTFQAFPLPPFYYGFLEAIWIKKITPSKIQPVPHCHRRLSRKTGQHPVQYDEMVKHQNALRAYFEHFPPLGGDSPPRP